MDDDIAVQLCENQIFEGLTPEQVQGILPCIIYADQQYSHAECVTDKGEPLHNFGVVLDGALFLCDCTTSKANRTVGQVHKNGLFGEMLIFARNSATPYRVVAGERTRILFLSSSFFLRICSKECANKATHQQVVYNLLRHLSEQGIQLKKKVDYLSAPDLKTKIAKYLLDLYELNRCSSFAMPLNRDALADYFAVARPSLSRELNNLKKAGIIDFYRSNMQVLDPDYLSAVAHGEEPAKVGC